ncbi:integrase domain-containing protein [Enterobacter hormaechei]|uniref:integrase domain-containing protein n=1 Tax=Enterobacter hormaechei TaxID=158836 RepID=UPI0032DAF44D
MSKLSKQLVTLARQAGGSFKTVSDRSKIADRLAIRMAKLNIQIRDVKHVKTHHIERYIQSRLAENISKRTIQNEMAAIRAILSAAGRSKLADPQHEHLNNAALGLSGASRDGTKVAISNERYHRALASISMRDTGVAAAVRLARVLGLRTEEAVQAAKSLKTWQRALINGEPRLRIVFGTKGGRPRDTTVLDHHQVLSVVNEALQHVDQNNGKLIDKLSLHSAIDRYRNVVREAGLTGKYAPHSLRYAWANDALTFHQRRGLSRDEARAMVSMDLGHGDGRGRYVARVYSKIDDG